jgi:hypothetical protein
VPASAFDERRRSGEKVEGKYKIKATKFFQRFFLLFHNSTAIMLSQKQTERGQ